MSALVPRSVVRAAVVAALTALAFVLSPVGASAASKAEEPTLTVRGQGTSRGVPDSATLTASVARRARTARAARAAADQRTRRLLAALLATGIDRSDLQTSSIALSREGRRVFVASTSITVRTRRVDLVPALVSAATRGGADDVQGPGFTVADPSSAVIAATDAALADARRRADAAAAAIGKRIGGVQSVDLDPGFGAQSDDGVVGQEGSGGPRRPPPVEPGGVDVRATVEVVFELEG